MSEKSIRAKRNEKSEEKLAYKPVKSVKEMTDKLVKIEKEIKISEKCYPTFNSLEINKSIPEEEWAKIGNFLVELELKDTIQWWLGDWYIFGKDNKLCKYLKYDVYNYRTVQNAAWVCRRIEPSRRREELSFGHHQVVAPLPPEEQDEWLDDAERCGISVKKLRNEIKRRKIKSEAKKNEDYSVPVRYQGEIYYFLEFLKLSTYDVNKLKNRLIAINNVTCYASFSHLLNPEEVLKNSVKEDFVESCRMLLKVLKYVLSENLSDNSLDSLID